MLSILSYSTDDQVVCVLPEVYDLLLFLPITLCLSSYSMQGNLFITWAHTLVTLQNESNCWICGEMPFSAANELPRKNSSCQPYYLMCACYLETHRDHCGVCLSYNDTPALFFSLSQNKTLSTIIYPLGWKQIINSHPVMYTSIWDCLE